MWDFLKPAIYANWMDTIWHFIPLALTLQQYQGLSGMEQFNEWNGVIVLLININIGHVTLNLMLDVMSRRPAQVLPPPQNGMSIGSIMGIKFANWLFGAELPDYVFQYVLCQNTVICLGYFYTRIFLLSYQFLEYEGMRNFFFVPSKKAAVAPSKNKKEKAD